MTNASGHVLPFSEVYVNAFFLRSHQLVSLGYARLVPAKLAALDETAITGMLCDAMEAALDARDAPEWAPHLTVVDEQPESVEGKTGKRRPRTDVCVRCINPRPAARFRFEAKRLNKSRALKAYLGDEGMLALITGYYGDLPHAGMLGYVQTGTCATWRSKIEDEIRQNPKAYYAAQPVEVEDLATGAPDAVFCSGHQANPTPVRIRITHTLLLCA